MPKRVSSALRRGDAPLAEQPADQDGTGEGAVDKSPAYGDVSGAFYCPAIGVLLSTLDCAQRGSRTHHRIKMRATASIATQTAKSQV